MVWGVSLSPLKLIPQRLTPGIEVYGIRSLVGFSNLVRPLAHPVLYLRHSFTRGYTKIYFGENQLFPSLIGLSPLPTAHPSTFQRTIVRTSMTCYRHFILAMGRSLRFRVYSVLLVALFRLAFATAPSRKDLTSQY